MERIIFMRKRIIISLLILSIIIFSFAYAENNNQQTPDSNVTATAASNLLPNKVAGYPDIKIYKSNVKIYIENKLVDFEKIYGSPVISINGRIMLPARAFTYYINGVISNSDGTPYNTAYINYYPDVQLKTDMPKMARTDGLKNSTDFLLRYEIPNSQYEYHSVMLQNLLYAISYYQKKDDPVEISHKTFKMDIPPLVTDINGGTTYLPLRVQAYLFDFGVKYDVQNNAVYISKNIPQEFGDGIELLTNDPQYQDQYIGKDVDLYPDYGTYYQNGQVYNIPVWDGK